MTPTRQVRRKRIEEVGQVCSCSYYTHMVTSRLDLDLLDDDEPFEIDRQAAHLFKHVTLGIDDIHEVWRSDPLFNPAKQPADWLMVSEVSEDR